MGNNCLRKDLALQAQNQQMQQKEKRQQANLEGQYKNRLNDNRNQLVRQREMRMRTYEQKLNNLKKQLALLEDIQNPSSQQSFKKKKLHSQINALQKMINNTDNGIKNMKSEIEV